MRIFTLVASATIVLAMSIGSASAADELATLDGVKATPMASSELDAIKGMHVHFKIITKNGEVMPATTTAAPLDGPFFRIGDPAKCSFPDPCADAPGIAGLLHADAVPGNPIVVFCGPAACLPQ